MNQLLPIIRRVRRPLLVEDKPPVVTGNVEPVKAHAEGEACGAETLPVNVQSQPPTDHESSSAPSDCPY